MTANNFDGHGLADQPSIIYGFEADGEQVIREFSRSGYGQPGPSPGDVIERETTKSSLDDRLPEFELPGQRGLAQDDCGEDIPAFACLGDDGCGHPVYVGRTCASPVCGRDWPAAVKDKVTRWAGKLEGFRRALYARYNGRRDIDFNHVVASLPSVVFDSKEPTERALLLLKTLLEQQWGIDGFAAIYHPYRIKKEYRKDQYEHGGEEGEGDMTWKDVLNADNPEQYIKFEPHFHLFFPAVRKSFDYSVAEAVEEQTGWLFHRITKGEDSNVSVEDLDDLVHQLTYCFSHAGVEDTSAGRSELVSRMKGDLHDCYIPDGVGDEVLAMFCDAAPRLLGVQFANLNNATCDAEVSAEGRADGSDEDDTDDSVSESTRDTRRPIDDHPDGGRRASGGSRDPRLLDSLVAAQDVGEDDLWGSGATWSSERDTSITTDEEASQSGAEASSVVDDRVECGGSLAPIQEAEDRLEDEEWCRQAEYVAGLRTAVDEWHRRTGGDEELPWDDEGVIEPD